MTAKEIGIRQIDEANWDRDEYGTLFLRTICDKEGRKVEPWMSIRPVYCDRGHMQVHIDGNLNLDEADGFPRFFFSFDEADKHTRTFLMWRLWQVRSSSYEGLEAIFRKGAPNERE